MFVLNVGCTNNKWFHSILESHCLYKWFPIATVAVYLAEMEYFTITHFTLKKTANAPANIKHEQFLNYSRLPNNKQRLVAPTLNNAIPHSQATCAIEWVKIQQFRTIQHEVRDVVPIGANGQQKAIWLLLIGFGCHVGQL